VSAWNEPSRLIGSLTLGACIAGAVLADFHQIGGAAGAEPSPGYAELQQAVLDGRGIRMTIDLAQCVVHGTDRSGPPIRGSLRFDAVMIEGDGTIAFATTHFTVRSDDTPVDEFISFRVHPDAKIEAHSRFLNAATYALFQEAAFDCDIGRGAIFHW
jgi:VirK protein